MYLVLDTNTVISGLLWQGPPGRILDAAQAGIVRLFVSTPMLDELQGVLKREKFVRQLATIELSSDLLFQGYAALCTIVTPAGIGPVVLADPVDDMVIATALAAQADIIVTRDAAVLNVKRYHGIDILNATEALAVIEAATKRN